MAFHRLTASLSVFVAETCSTGVSALDRRELAVLCGVEETEDTRRLPLLYSLVANRQQAEG